MIQESSCIMILSLILYFPHYTTFHSKLTNMKYKHHCVIFVVFIGLFLVILFHFYIFLPLNSSFPSHDNQHEIEAYYFVHVDM